MFEYTFTSPKEIRTPFCTDIKQIKKEIISHSPKCIHSRSTYPNGVVMESIQYADKVIFKSNKPLIDNGDGTLSVQL